MLSFKEYLEESKPKIGKDIGGCTYVHKDYEHTLPQDHLSAAKKHLPKDFDYTAVKHDRKTNAMSFIKSPDFDTAHEPTVGDSIKVNSDGSTKTTKALKDPWIWHHKHQWVGDDYKGFDVDKSKKRSEAWKPLIKKGESAYIGKKSYWDKNIVPKIPKLY